MGKHLTKETHLMCSIPVLKCGCHMAAGTVYADCLTTQCTWKTMNRWRETLSGGFRLFLSEKSTTTQSRCTSTHMGGNMFGCFWVTSFHPRTHTLVCSVWLWRIRTNKSVYFFSSSLDIRLINLFIWRKEKNAGESTRHFWGKWLTLMVVLQSPLSLFLKQILSC